MDSKINVSLSNIQEFSNPEVCILVGDYLDSLKYLNKYKITVNGVYLTSLAQETIKRVKDSELAKLYSLVLYIGNIKDAETTTLKMGTDLMGNKIYMEYLKKFLLEIGLEVSSKDLSSTDLLFLGDVNDDLKSLVRKKKIQKLYVCLKTLDQAESLLKDLKSERLSYRTIQLF